MWKKSGGTNWQKLLGTSVELDAIFKDSRTIQQEACKHQIFFSIWGGAEVVISWIIGDFKHIQISELFEQTKSSLFFSLNSTGQQARHKIVDLFWESILGLWLWPVGRNKRFCCDQFRWSSFTWSEKPSIPFQRFMNNTWYRYIALSLDSCGHKGSSCLTKTMGN